MISIHTEALRLLLCITLMQVFHGTRHDDHLIKQLESDQCVYSKFKTPNCP